MTENIFMIIINIFKLIQFRHGGFDVPLSILNQTIHRRKQYYLHNSFS